MFALISTDCNSVRKERIQNIVKNSVFEIRFWKFTTLVLPWQNICLFSLNTGDLFAVAVYTETLWCTVGQIFYILKIWQSEDTVWQDWWQLKMWEETGLIRFTVFEKNLHKSSSSKHLSITAEMGLQFGEYCKIVKRDWFVMTFQVSNFRRLQ